MRRIRRSQIVSPFGPGAIIDLVGESFVAEDAGNWRGKPEYVSFPRLAAYLRVDELRTPRPGGKLPYFRFPQWLFCFHCRRMARWSYKREKPNEAPMCETCGGRRQLVPMRFVAVCGNGHLTDVNWFRWAHSDPRRDRNQAQCATTDLRFENRSDVGGGLRSLEVVCRRCRAHRSLENLTMKGALTQIGMKCPGTQPWQSQADQQPCGEPLIAMQRGASSVYFPTVVSAIDIPPESDYSETSSVSSALAHRKDFKLLISDPQYSLRDGIVAHIAQEMQITPAAVEAELASQLTEEPGTEQGSPDDIHPNEWKALCTPQDRRDPRDNFITRRAQRPDSRVPAGSSAAELAAILDDIILVDRLREVRVLTDFKRYTMREPVPANLSGRGDFLPAVEVFGEGYFLRFNESALTSWETQPKVRERCDKLIARKQAHASWLTTPTPRLVLLHTFAHLLLRNTAFEAGYSTSSLRERLYVTPESNQPAMAGILVYTAAGDTEGTLGGLVRMGEYERLSRLFYTSVASAQWCSFDPVCGESPGQGPGGLSLAACHACSLVPETSCVAANRLLDRKLLIDEEYGFFTSLATALDQVPGGGTW
ncbi:DrmB family protein [Saccharopolyspora shandongensis]|uniref:DrmB family protein n=1 Tax=Saccharopolyspora shandongensis TaxID=418495 RepID=UPI00341D776C